MKYTFNLWIWSSIQFIHSLESKELNVYVPKLFFQSYLEAL